MPRPTHGVLLAVSASVVCFAPLAASGQCFATQDAVPPPIVAAQSRFGTSLAMRGSLAVVGQPYFPVRQAQVYGWNGSMWVYLVSLADTAPVSGFSGYSVDTDGARVIFSSTLGPNGGAVLIYRRVESAFVFEARLTPPGNGANGSYGSIVAIDGDMAAIEVDGGPSEVHIYRRMGGVWVFSQTITDPTPQPGQDYIDSLDLSAGHLVIGSVQDQSLDVGALFVYQRVNDALTFQQRLLATGPGVVRNLGHAVAIEGGTIVASAGFNPNTAEDVYVFSLSDGAWTQSATVPRRDQNNWQGFGDSLALSGDLLAVGSSAHDAVGSDSGAVFIYRRNGSAWLPVSDLPNPSPSPSGDLFGERVALSDGRLLAAAPGDKDAGPATGSVYSYTSSTVGIIHGPDDQNVPLGGSAQFTVNATGQGTLAYRWKIGGVTVPTGLAPYQGADTPLFKVTHAAAPLLGAISVQVTDACGFSVSSAPASLLVSPGGTCPGDADGDGHVQFIDITTVLSNFGAICQ